MTRPACSSVIHMQASVVELIAAKRDGRTLAPDDIRRLVAAFVSGEMADYQMASFLMAVYLRGLDVGETTALTFAMLHSGSVLDLGQVPRFKVDKHSTGGVGDKVSICLAPLVAACGVAVPMVSGRGLGHTGGTLDKLEAIPGFRTDLPVDQFVRIVGDVGVCMIGQTKDIAPADRRMYALRDVTATVESIPLIVASILSKKLAEGIDGLVLDVKVGRGAFMKTEATARELAQALVDTGVRAGKKVVALLTDMSAPLGVAIGNANETREALEMLHGHGPEDLRECTLVLAEEMLLLAGRVTERVAARELLLGAVASGEALRVMERMVAAQGGDAKTVSEPDRLVVAPGVPVTAETAGVVTEVDPLEMGLAAVALGAGRSRADQAVDPAVGIMVRVRPGARVERGDLVAEVQTRDKAAAASILDRVRRAVRIGDEPVAKVPLVRGRVEASPGEQVA
jgi:pyrimidine-nucleoside phosphorylase